MNKEQVGQIEKRLGIKVSPLAKDLVNAATAFCWQPLKIENGIMVLGVYEKDPLRIIEHNAKEIVGRRTDTGKVEFLQIDLEKENMSEVANRFLNERIVTPLNSASYGQKAEAMFNDAKKALIIGDYNYACESVKKASRGNPNYGNKQKHIASQLNSVVGIEKTESFVL